MITFPPFNPKDPSDDPSGTMRLAGSGQFNQMVWRTDPRGDHTGLEAQIITLHEWSHNELNNVSVYGAFLTAFAYLARHAKTDRGRHLDTLCQLAERSRLAHEVYATWYSTDMFLLRADLGEMLALYPQDYQSYFAAGAKLVEGIDSPFLRQQAFLCAVRICFSVAAFAEFGSNIAAFRAECVRAELYPSNVFQLLTGILPTGFFVEQLQEFLPAQTGNGIAQALEKACGERRRDADFFGSISTAQADAATRELHGWFHGKLAALLAARGVECVPYGSHLALLQEVLPQLAMLCDSAAVTHPLVSNSRPHDNAANLLLHMENEVLRIRPEPLPCTLHSIADVPRERWPHLATGEPRHYFFCARRPSQLLAQHRFPADQCARLREMTGPVVVLRRRASRDDEAECEMFLFQSPEEVEEFRCATENVPAFSSIAMSALGDTAWCEHWLSPLTRQITGTILFDRSVFHTIRDGWEPYVSVRYAKGVLRAGETSHVFLTFLAESKEGYFALYLAPCGELFARATAAFIENELPPSRFVRDERFMSELSWLLPPVMTHLVAEDYFFSFNEVQYS